MKKNENTLEKKLLELLNSKLKLDKKKIESEEEIELMRKIIFNSSLREFLCSKVNLNIDFDSVSFDPFQKKTDYFDEQIEEQKKIIEECEEQKEEIEKTDFSNSFLQFKRAPSYKQYRLNEENEVIKNRKEVIIKYQQQKKEILELQKQKHFSSISEDKKKNLEGKQSFYLSNLLKEVGLIEIFTQDAHRFFSGFGSNNIEVLQFIKRVFFIVADKIMEDHEEDFSKRFEELKKVINDRDVFELNANGYKRNLLNIILERNWDYKKNPNSNDNDVKFEKVFSGIEKGTRRGDEAELELSKFLKDSSICASNYFITQSRRGFEWGFGGHTSKIIDNTVFQVLLEKEKINTLAFISLCRTFILKDKGYYYQEKRVDGEEVIEDEKVFERRKGNTNWLESDRFLRFMQTYLNLLFYEFKNGEIGNILSKENEDIINSIRIAVEDGSLEGFLKENYKNYYREVSNEYLNSDLLNTDVFDNKIFSYFYEKSVPPWILGEIFSFRSNSVPRLSIGGSDGISKVKVSVPSDSIYELEVEKEYRFLTEYDKYKEIDNEKYVENFQSKGILVDSCKVNNCNIHSLFFKNDEEVKMVHETQDIFSTNYNTMVFQPFCSELWSNKELSDNFMNVLDGDSLRKAIEENKQKQDQKGGNDSEIFGPELSTDFDFPGDRFLSERNLIKGGKKGFYDENGNIFIKEGGIWDKKYREGEKADDEEYRAFSEGRLQDWKEKIKKKVSQPNHSSVFYGLRKVAISVSVDSEICNLFKKNDNTPWKAAPIVLLPQARFRRDENKLYVIPLWWNPITHSDSIKEYAKYITDVEQRSNEIKNKIEEEGQISLVDVVEVESFFRPISNNSLDKIIETNLRTNKTLSYLFNLVGEWIKKEEKNRELKREELARAIKDREEREETKEELEGEEIFDEKKKEEASKELIKPFSVGVLNGEELLKYLVVFEIFIREFSGSLEIKYIPSIGGKLLEDKAILHVSVLSKFYEGWNWYLFHKIDQHVEYFYDLYLKYKEEREKYTEVFCSTNDIYWEDAENVNIIEREKKVEICKRFSGDSFLADYTIKRYNEDEEICSIKKEEEKTSDIKKEFFNLISKYKNKDYLSVLDVINKLTEEQKVCNESKFFMWLFIKIKKSISIYLTNFQKEGYITFLRVFSVAPNCLEDILNLPFFAKFSYGDWDVSNVFEKDNFIQDFIFHRFYTENSCNIPHIESISHWGLLFENSFFPSFLDNNCSFQSIIYQNFNFAFIEQIIHLFGSLKYKSEIQYLISVLQNDSKSSHIRTEVALYLVSSNINSLILRREKEEEKYEKDEESVIGLTLSMLSENIGCLSDQMVEFATVYEFLSKKQRFIETVTKFWEYLLKNSSNDSEGQKLSSKICSECPKEWILYTFKDVIANLPKKRALSDIYNSLFKESFGLSGDNEEPVFVESKKSQDVFDFEHRYKKIYGLGDDEQRRIYGSLVLGLSGEQLSSFVKNYKSLEDWKDKKIINEAIKIYNIKKKEIEKSMEKNEIGEEKNAEEEQQQQEKTEEVVKKEKKVLDATTPPAMPLKAGEIGGVKTSIIDLTATDSDGAGTNEKENNIPTKVIIEEKEKEQIAVDAKEQATAKKSDESAVWWNPFIIFFGFVAIVLFVYLLYLIWSDWREKEEEEEEIVEEVEKKEEIQ